MSNDDYTIQVPKSVFLDFHRICPPPWKYENLFITDDNERKVALFGSTRGNFEEEDAVARMFLSLLECLASAKENENRPISPGDVVCLKSGGIAMTVNSLVGESTVSVVFSLGNQGPVTKSVPKHLLKHLA